MRGRSGSRYGLRAALALVSAVALVMGMTGSLFVVSAQSVRPQIEYQVQSLGADTGPLCVGDTTGFLIRVIRITTVNGRHYVQGISGGKIVGIVDDKQVGEFTPDEEVRDVGGAPLTSARFLFLAKSPGSTEIEFTIGVTGEEHRTGDDPAFYTYHLYLEVEVVNCFEAYTSGLGTVFDLKDMGALDQYFTLGGRIIGEEVAGKSQTFSFVPDPQNRTTGIWALVEEYYPLANPDAKCNVYVGGSYDVVFYPDEDHVVEGDLLLKGSGVNVCAGSTIPIDYETTGFQVGFKPRPQLPPSP